MLAVILATDQLVWRPLLVWADKFKMELTESAHPPTSWFYNLLQRDWIGELILIPLSEFYTDIQLKLSAQRNEEHETPGKAGHYVRTVMGIVLLLALLYVVVLGFMAGFDAVYHRIPGSEILEIFALGFVTLSRVIAVTILATLIWTPIGVWIGSKPRVAQFAQPLVQMFASFSGNMTFPLSGWVVCPV